MTSAAAGTSPIEYTAQADAFRHEIRDWLDENAPDDLRGILVPRDPSPELTRRLADWAARMADAGYMCVAWPTEYGGRGLSGIEVAVMNEEFGRAGVPRLTRGMGESLVGPAVINHATDEQKRRILPPIISGEHVFCQGFSEPDAGSDLASLRTTGVVDGDELVINGQKVWTSGYYQSNWIFVLCRTDPAAPKHRGISYVLVPIERDGQPNGIRFSPITRITGVASFAETFFDDCRASLDDVIGGLHDGWRVAMTTLGSERGGSATTQHVAFAREWDHLVELARQRGRTDDPVVRNQLAWAFANIEVIRYTGLELLAALAAGRPAANLGNGSSAKIRWSEYQRRMAEFALDIVGPEAFYVEDDYRLDEWQETFLVTRSHTIWGGTAEIQRNILAERVLGMPRDPAPADLKEPQP
jgi:alkylation response protein AidB-like acyl-CoA dehydrogenase